MRGIGHKVEALVVAVVFVVALTYVGDGSKRTSVPEVQRRPVGTQNLSPRFREAGRIVFQNYRRGIVLPTDSAVRVIVYRPRAARAD